MAWSHTQSILGADGTATSSTSIFLAFGSAVSTNGLVVGSVLWGDDVVNISTVADDKGNSYTVIDTVHSAGDGASVAQFYKEGITNAPTTITITFGSSVPFRRMALSEYAGIATSSALDGHTAAAVTNPGTGADIVVTGSVTPTSDGQLIRGAVFDTSGNPQTMSAGTSPNAFTQRLVSGASQAVPCEIEDFLQTTAAPITATAGATTNDNFIASIATFKIAAAGPSLTATNLATGADGFANSQPGLVNFIPIWINTWVLDNGLNGLDSNSDSVYICSSQPADFTGATVTLGLGSFSFGVGNVFPSGPTNGSPNGRVLTSSAITNGSVTANGTPTYWAIVDTANTRLLATGPLSGGVAVSNGNLFTLGAITVHIPAS